MESRMAEQIEADLGDEQVVNHKSFYSTFGEDVAPGVEQVQAMIEKGFVSVYASLEEAELAVG
eukprot:4977467-Amphidinium_carterae.1